MGALVAAINRERKNVIPTVVSMMAELSHRGKNSYGISSSDFVKKSENIYELENTNFKSNLALGHNLSCNLARDRAQPVKGNGFSFVFEGRMFPSPNLPDLSEAKEFLKFLKPISLQSIQKILKTLDGSYVFAIAESQKIFVGRDVFGEIPLYYGKNQEFLAVASERKALWKIGLKDVKSFPSGHLAIMSEDGFFFITIKKLQKPPKEKIHIETAARALELLMLESTRKHVSDLEKVGVAFSGGLDSSVIAVLAKYVGLNVHLVSVGLKDQPELVFVKEAAKALDLPLYIQTYAEDDLEDTLSRVIWLIEEPNVVNACISVPFYWVAETASKLNCPVLLAGQGADELFGGYQRYLTEYQKSGIEVVEQKMFHDIVNAYAANFQRDNQVCSYHNVELRLPFVDFSVIDFVLRLPLRFKINSINDQIRKHILRKVAQNLDIPKQIADKPKKAIQYSTGITKALRNLAKKEKIDLRTLVNNTYSRVFSSKI